ncbi:MAG: hypothetical protein PHY02_03090 [Phycisphaerae bacterium]|nr:hypothetical protein [Phycisphaerae bacterium]
MKHWETEKKKKELNVILADENAGRRLEKLQRLAKEVGAGYVHQEFSGITTEKTATGETKTIHYNPISESELVQNINNAL